MRISIVGSNPRRWRRSFILFVRRRGRRWAIRSGRSIIMRSMENIKIASAQFEHASGDKARNLDAIRRLTASAAAAGAQAVAFHECSISGYSFARRLSKGELLEVAETIPEGPSIRALTEMARQYDITILAGLFEKVKQDGIYKAYVAVDRGGLLAKFRKLHPFINPHIIPGD